MTIIMGLNIILPGGKLNNEIPTQTVDIMGWESCLQFPPAY